MVEKKKLYKKWRKSAGKESQKIQSKKFLALVTNFAIGYIKKLIPVYSVSRYIKSSFKSISTKYRKADPKKKSIIGSISNTTIQ